MGSGGIGVAVEAFSSVGVGAIVGVSLALATADSTSVGVGAARPIGRSQPVTEVAVTKSAVAKTRVRLFILFSPFFIVLF